MVRFSLDLLHVSWKTLLSVKVAVVVRHAIFVVVSSVKMGFGSEGIAAYAEPKRSAVFLLVAIKIVSQASLLQSSC